MMSILQQEDWEPFKKMTEKKPFLSFSPQEKARFHQSPPWPRTPSVLVIIATSLWYIIQRDIFYLVYFPSDDFVVS